MSFQITLAELAERFGLQARGDGASVVHGVATLANAGAGQLAFLANSKYRGQLETSAAAVVVLRDADADAAPNAALIAKDPHAAFAKISALFEPVPSRPAGIHPSASIDATAKISPSAHIGANVVVGANSVVGDGAMIGAGSIIGEDCRVGDGCELVARVTLVTRVTLGKRVRIHPGAVLGAAGFGLAMEAGKWLNVPQLGGVKVGDDCEIGANTTIDRGALEDTVLEDDVRLDNLVQIAHNVRIGAHSAMAAQVGVAGSTRIGRYCMFGGQVGIAGHLTICDQVIVLGKSMVGGDIDQPGEYSSGMPATDSRSWRKIVARLRQIDSMSRLLRAATKPDPTKDSE